MADFSISANDIFEWRIYAYFQSSVIMNVFHYKVSPTFAGTTSGVAAIRAWQHAALGILYGAGGVIPVLQHRDLTYNYSEVQIVYPVRTFYVDEAMGYNGSINTSPALPSDTQLAVTYRAATTGRGKAGRKSFTGFNTAQFTGPSWNATLLTPFNSTVRPALEQSIDITTPIAMVCDPVIWSVRDGATSNELVSCYVNPQVRIMRRRQLGIGQ